jgi:hypothetical protein
MNAAVTTLDAPPAEIRISILHVADCPLVSRVQAILEVALQRVGATAAIEQIEGAHPSPTLLIDGFDVAGHPSGSDPACRIALPTIEEIATAIRAALVRRTSPTCGEGAAQ